MSAELKAENRELKQELLSITLRDVKAVKEDIEQYGVLSVFGDRRPGRLAELEERARQLESDLRGES